jgi:hypothetical protein
MTHGIVRFSSSATPSTATSRYLPTRRSSSGCRCSSTKNMLPLLEGKQPGPPTPTLTFARYELRKVEDRWQYHFVESVSMEFDLEAIRKAVKKEGPG